MNTNRSVPLSVLNPDNTTVIVKSMQMTKKSGCVNAELNLPPVFTS